MGRNDPCPNPLFLSLLEKWVEEAKNEGNKNKEFTYQKALKNLRKFPLPIQRGSQATIVDGIGPKIASRFDKELEKRGLETQQGEPYVASKTATGLNSAEASKPKNPKAKGNLQEDSDAEPPKPKRRINREYVPTFRSGAYAIVRCLYQAAVEGIQLSKKDITSDAQQWADASFTVSEPGKFQTAWSSMALLIKKDLVMRKGHPQLFSLSDEGLELAERMMKADDPNFVPHFNIKIDRIVDEPPRKAPARKKKTKEAAEDGAATDPKPQPSKRGKRPGAEEEESPDDVTYVLPKAANISTIMTDHDPRRRYLAQGGGVRTIQVGGPLKRSVSLEPESPMTQPKAIRKQESSPSSSSHGSESGCSRPSHVTGSTNTATRPSSATSNHSQNTHTSRLPHTGLNRSDSVRSSGDWRGSSPSPPLGTPNEDVIGRPSGVCSYRGSSIDSDDDSPLPHTHLLFSYVTGDSAETSNKELAYVSIVVRFDKASARVQRVDILTDEYSENLHVSGTEVQSRKACSESQPYSSTGSGSRMQTSSYIGGAAMPIRPLPPRPASSMSSKVVDLTDSPDRPILSQRRAAPSENPRVTPAPWPSKHAAPDFTPSPFQAAPKLRKVATEPVFSCNHDDDSGHEHSQPSPPPVQSKLRPAVSDPSPIREAQRAPPRPVVPERSVVLRAGEYDIVLLLDNREDRGYIQQKLQENGVNCVVRALQLGDFLWVARRKRSMEEALMGVRDDSGEEELVLGYIGERKRMDDLSSSIIDGRFREQHFRLSQCGLDHVIYLVENKGSIDSFSVPAERLQTAMVTVQVQHGFFLQRCLDTEDSIRYLTSVTKHLTDKFMGKTLATAGGMTPVLRHQAAMELGTYASLSARVVKRQVLTATDIFAKQLMCIRLMTPERAKAIINIYPTPTSLIMAYEACATVQERKVLLAGVEYARKKTVGKKLSEMLYLLYCRREYTQNH